VAHSCNPNYSGGRDLEDCSSKPATAKCSLRPSLEKILHKKGLVEWLKVEALSSNPSTSKKPHNINYRLIYIFILSLM
jgi:hypothetical protein